MDESIKDLQSDQRSSIPLDSSDGCKKEKVLPNASSSVEALQALQLMIKDIANIQDPKEASDARKECYGFYKKILDQMEPAETLRIRENSKRIISANERYERRTRFFVICTTLMTAMGIIISTIMSDDIPLIVTSVICGLGLLGLVVTIFGYLWNFRSLRYLFAIFFDRGWKK